VGSLPKLSLPGGLKIEGGEGDMLVCVPEPFQIIPKEKYEGEEKGKQVPTSYG